jgi:putative transposase
MKHVDHQLLYHVVWSTRNGHIIHDDLEGLIGSLVRENSARHRGIPIAVSVMPDHIHLFVALPPSVIVSSFVSCLKRDTAKMLVERHPMSAFDLAWERGWSIQTIRAEDVEEVRAYVSNQAERHALSAVRTNLEPGATAHVVLPRRKLNPVAPESSSRRTGRQTLAHTWTGSAQTRPNSLPAG